MTKTRDLSDFLIEGGADLPIENAHIIPGVLYPAYNNKRLDGTDLVASTTGPAGSTVASSKYGTVQASDGRMYYYTDIKGSKPIKDPRIGAHFGSQRHKFKSFQKLEQETAEHGNHVYSVDGREWMRTVGAWIPDYSSSGHGWYVSDTNSGGSDFIEIVGYFSDVNTQEYANVAHDKTVSVDGTVVGSNPNTSHSATVNNPLTGRFVDCGSLVNLALGQTLGIHTLKLASVNGDYLGSFFSIELIVQDTTSTANRSKIQIPAQNVVSVGKKFAISATADHYDPFSAKTDGSAWTSPTSGTNNANSAASWPTNIDTAHSLGLDKWVDGSSYYRPYNGGRVVKYVDSTGTIKTAVTMMPPNAKSIKSGDINKKAKNAGNTTYLPTFEDETTDINEDQLHEVAKTFYWREFGNGAANTGGGGNWADASMLNSEDDIAFVMDDGLTSLGADDVTPLSQPTHAGNALNLAADDRVYITFIGTGISIYSLNWAENAAAWQHIAQNLPYGTHVLRIYRDGSNNSTILLDGVEVKGSTGTAPFKNPSEITFHQPKMPPIPEDVVVLADYMLMADFVIKTGLDPTFTSKGVLRKDVSRDMFYNGSAATLSFNSSGGSGGFWVETGDSSGGTAGDRHATLPSFATNFSATGYNFQSRMDLDLNGSTATYTNVNTGNAHNTFAHLTNNTTLGVNNFKVKNKANSRLSFAHLEVASPIHTSHHYQAFETQFLHELIGGDRNMEQTNLVCSPDGKTWDQLTRDTSYIGQEMFKPATTNSQSSSTGIVAFNKFRSQNVGSDLYQKNFAIAYTRFICLRDGMYQIQTSTMKNINLTYHANIKINGVRRKSGHSTNIDHDTITNILTTHLKRGDYVEVEGGWYASAAYGHFEIIRLEK